MLGLDALLGIGGKLIDKLIPDPEQKAKAAANMAKARAARKLNLEKPSIAAIEQPQPTLVVEEVTE